MKRFLLFAFLVCASIMVGQKGKTGTVTISSATTIVNDYTSLTADAAATTSVLTVVTTASFAPGDLLMIIQMQGASVNCAKEGANPNNSMPMQSTYGGITSYNNAGNNELAEVYSVPNGTTVNLDCGLKNNYTAAGKVQVIKVPRYAQLTLSAAATITCPLWNGTTGGVIAIEVDGVTTINPGCKIDASGSGFRGGMVSNKSGTAFGGNAWGHVTRTEGSWKGESIAGDTTLYAALFSGRVAKGAVANGGGGGTAVNGGGGGGANAGDTSAYTGKGNPDISVSTYTLAWELEAAGMSTTTSSGGGKGGYSYANSTNNPLTSGPGAAGWGGDNRRIQGGYGGRPLKYDTGRLYLGGGGGAGDHDNNMGGAGANGGGIIYITTYNTISGGGQIISNGGIGANTNTVPAAGAGDCSGKDGAGGGGGGGAIVIKTSGPAITNLTVTANGGNGGWQFLKSGFGGSNQAYGPGGGGGGGYIGTSPGAVIATSVAGGANGMFAYSSGANGSLIDNNFPPNGATSGGGGIVTSTIVVNPTITTTTAYTICAGNALTLTATSTNTNAAITWYNNASGATAVGAGTVYVTPVYNTVGVYTVFPGTCPGVYRQPILINVIGTPTLIVNTPTICPNGTATLTASGATTYTWSTGSNSSSITINPTVTTVYTVTGSNAACSSAKTATVVVSSSPTITVNTPTVCSGGQATLTANGATTYTWSTGSNSSSITINPTVTTVYTVTGSNGTCSTAKTATVIIGGSPTITVNTPTICPGQTVTLTANGATSYTWNTGATTATLSVNPATTTNYTVTGASGSCSAAVIATVIVGQTPTITATSATICTGGTATLIAGGGTSYTWNPGGVVASTYTASPGSNSTYTVIGSNGTCSATAIGSITIGSNLSLIVNTPTICVGQTATLTASGATNYTWTTGNTTYTIEVTPGITTTYTVIGTSGTCSGTATGTVIVNANPTVAVAGGTLLCSGQSTTLTASGGLSYTWAPTGTNGSTIAVTPSVTTTYTVFGDNAAGCLNGASLTLSVNTTPTLGLNFPVICSGSATLTAFGANNYTWTPGGSNSGTIVVSPTVTTSYTVIGDINGCTTVGMTSVTVNTAPPMNITVSQDTICQNACITFTNLGSGFSLVNFNFGDGTIGTATDVIHCYTVAGTYTVIANATFSTGCSVTSANILTITVGNMPIPTFSIVGTSPFAPNVAIGFNNLTTGPNKYWWDFGDATPISNLYSPTHIFAKIGTSCVTLHATDSISGCNDYQTQCLDIKNPIGINIPNLFTPNNDGINDVFTIKCVGIKELNCVIFDRWGLRLYEWDGIGGGWDGHTKSGDAVSNGTYFYILQYTDIEGLSKTTKGNITLFKN